MKTEYFQLLKDPRWQKKRLEKLEASNWHCDNCGDHETTLHVHHRQYFKNRMPWDYEDAQLHVLCEDCHLDEHQTLDELKDLISRASPSKSGALLAGFYEQDELVHWGDIESFRQGDHYTYLSGVVARIVSELTAVHQMQILVDAVKLSGNKPDNIKIINRLIDLYGDIQ